MNRNRNDRNRNRNRNDLSPPKPPICFQENRWSPFRDSDYIYTSIACFKIKDLSLIT